ncbi:MAG: DNA primase [Thermodesulfobacteriota bacterium]|nr:DNA primase [Thermodesulfobacteriota bacterium]
MFIPEDKIAELLNRADVVDVISESVVLKKSGRNYFGVCPFHSEKTPSFSVSPQKQIFHCFGCGVGGNVFSFLMRQHGLSFPEAVKMVARKYNVEIDTGPMSPEVKKKIELKEGLFRLNKRVADYYFNNLQKQSKAERARDYLNTRKITSDIIDLFHIGYSLDSWDDIVLFFRKMKLGRNLAEKSGLVLPKKQNQGYYDRFRNRIIFPIFDINMQVAGFGGRVMDDSMPKYLNSPETFVYNKGKILYGLHVSKQYCRQKDLVYIVEGYFDFLSLYQHGIKNVVASLGTALTEEHVRLLKGFALKMVLVFDSDAAGVNAAKRSISTFVKQGVDVRVLVLPKGKDPDSFVCEHGGRRFEELAGKAMEVIPFLTGVAVEKHGLSIEGKIKILDEIKPRIAEVEDSAARSLYVRELSEYLGIDEKAVLEKVRDVHSGQTIERIDLNRHGTEVLESDRREMQMLSMMIQYSDVRKEILAKNILDSFYSDRLKRIGKIVAGFEKFGPGLAADLMASVQNSEDQEMIASLAMMEIPGVDNLFEKSVSLMNRIVKVRNKSENILANRIRKAEQGGNSDLSLELLAKRQMEVRKLHGYEK